MADSTVSALNPATALNLTDYLLLTQAGNSLKIDVETLALKMPSRIIINEASENLTVAGAVATNKLTTKISAAGAFTLAAGTHGMEKTIVCTGVFASTLTITAGSGVSTVTFNAAGDSVKLQNIDNLWYVVGSNSVVIA